MSRAVYLLSDLHIGADPELDDFTSDDEISRFLARIEREEQGGDVELVLLGDVFDLWQIVPAQDKSAARSADIDLRLSTAGEIAKLQQAEARHPAVFEALRAFVRGDAPHRHLVIVPGNHDHSLVNPSVQQALRQLLAADRPPADAGLRFAFCYDNPALGIYAEHGNQYDQPNNAYDDFPQFGPMQECPGYFFVRLFWNRLERLDPQLDNLYPDKAWEVFLWILRTRHFSVLRPALRYFRQYRSDARVPKLIDVPGVPFFPGTSEPTLPGMPERLLDPDARSAPFFSADPAIENEYLRLYHEDPQAREQVEPMLREKFGEVPVLPPAQLATAFPAQPFWLNEDPYLTAVGRMFVGAAHAQKPCFAALLDPGRYRYIVLGHTHEDKQTAVSTIGAATYFNTGSWISRIDAAGKPVYRRPYLRIAQDDAGRISERFQIL